MYDGGAVKTRLLRLMITLAVPVTVLGSASTLAAPLQAAHTGAYHPLKAAESEAVKEGFDAAWLMALGEQAGLPITLADDPKQAGVHFGAIESGATYYSSEISALTPASSGPAQWKELSGQIFCVAEGSPHAGFVESTYGGVARTYPSAAHALIGLKLGECQAVIADRILLEQIAALPEWRRYNRLLPSVAGQTVSLKVNAWDPNVQKQIERAASSKQGEERLAGITQQWIDEVAFQAYVLADTLDCH